MRERLRKLTVPVLVAVALLATAIPVAPAVADGPFPCPTICVPSPKFPFVICNPDPSCPGEPGPGL